MDKTVLAVTSTLCVLFFSLTTPSALSEVGIDCNRPIDTETGLRAPNADPDLIADTGAQYVRVNFVLGPWSAPDDSTRYSGATWFERYDQIIDDFRSRGLAIYGLIGSEATAPLADLLRSPGPNPDADQWIEGYVRDFVTIVGRFKNRVRVFESFNEPNDWQGGTTAVVHAYWLARILERIYLEVKWNNGHSADPSWQVTLVSGPLFAFDLNNAVSYLRETYQYGINVHNWNDTRALVGTYPLDGIGYHLYVQEGAEATAESIRAALTSFLESLWNAVLDYEGQDSQKGIYISEFGWTSAVSEEFQEANLNTAFDFLKADPRIRLATWFSIGDFFPDGYGLYRMGGFAPEYRKLAYDDFQSQALGQELLPRCGIVVNGNAASTDGRQVELSINATDPDGYVAYMRFSNDNVNYSDWYPFSSTFSGWTLTEGAGLKTVWAEVRDNGNLVSNPASDTIELVSGADAGSGGSSGGGGACLAAAVRWSEPAEPGKNHPDRLPIVILAFLLIFLARLIARRLSRRAGNL